ncbi:hypothetical protein FSP39_015155 [Pinctada imbricata]|uniref:Transcriptional adapter n=1 Tax=Pinctada imbricata TaxID=66713 RepID=A0AA89BXG0_PINIB|nr:hypothetical protein FSP39_015155 [Pinctada imbricata]
MEETVECVCPSCGLRIYEPYIQCKQCPGETEVKICLLCFSKGAEFDEHKSDHGYVVVKNDFPLFENSWTANDEVTMLDTLSDCGYGNWSDVAQRMRTKSKEEIERHYNKCFINNPPAELPQFPEPAIERFPCPVTFKLCDDPPRYAESSTGFQEMGGYMAGRGDFNVEHDNYAELDVQSIQFDNPEEKDSLEQELELSVLDIYRSCLKERMRRKNIVRRFGLINKNRQSLYSRSYDSSFRETQENLRCFAALFTPYNFDKFVESLYHVTELKKSIKHLQEYRENGITELRNSKIYRILKSRRKETRTKRHLLDDILVHMRDETACQAWLQRQAVLDTMSKGSHIVLPNAPRRAAPPLDISTLPGYERLSESEKELCASTRLVPDAYLEFKTILVNECRKVGSLRLQHARTLIKIDVNKTRKLFDFLIDEGLINKD